MKLIPLTQSKFAKVDDEDFEYLNRLKWCAKRNRGIYYAARRDSRNNIFMHREIMKAQAGQIIDHIDRDGLNNQGNNLRFCTPSQNGANRKAHGASKYLGVSRLRNKWLATIRINKKKAGLGCFDNEIDAAKAYNNAAKKLHGEFANINII